MQQSSGSPPRPPMVATGPPTNTLAILSLVFGIVSWFALPVIGAIAAVVTGHMSRAEIRRTGEGGAGLALGGLILGYVHLALFAIAIAILVIVLLAVGGFFITHKGH